MIQARGIDAAAFARLHAATMALDRPWTAVEFADLLAAPGAVALGDEDAALLARVAAAEAEVLTLATHPACRRQGHARRLLDQFAWVAAARGATRAVLEVAEDNAPARALYEGAGYRLVGRRPAYYARGDRPPAAALVLARVLP